MCDLVVFVLCFFLCSISFSTLILLVGLLTCKNRLPYNLYCVSGDVKHCTIQFHIRW